MTLQSKIRWAFTGNASYLQTFLQPIHTTPHFSILKNCTVWPVEPYAVTGRVSWHGYGRILLTRLVSVCPETVFLPEKGSAYGFSRQGEKAQKMQLKLEK